MLNFKYHGELGYFIQTILAPLERFAEKNADKKGQITLYTYEGYDLIVETLLPGFFRFVLDKLSEKTGQPVQSMRRAGHADDYYTQVYNDIPFLHTNLEEAVELCLSGVKYGPANYIQKPLYLYDSNVDENTKKYKKTVVIFFRNRAHERERNHTLNSNHEQYFRDLFKNNDVLYVICSMNNECAIPEFVNEYTNIYKCEKLSELIHFFRVSDEFITNNSGLEDLAKVSGCKKISIFPNIHNEVVRASFEFRPFETEIRVLNKENPFEEDTTYRVTC